MAMCDQCERHLPDGCLHLHGDQKDCPVGPRTDLPWKVGKAIWDNLADRRSVGDSLEGCELDIQIEIIETMGKIALGVMEDEHGNH